MSIRVALHHCRHYSYDRLTKLGPQVVRLRPAPHCRTPVLSYSLRKLPLHPTGTQGEYIAGVRYRAWQPPSCLHPAMTLDLRRGRHMNETPH